jgi:hypothetical protein
MNREKDTVYLLRAVMKISIALTILDSIIDMEKYYKYGFKREARRWSSVIEIHIQELMNTLANEDSKLLMEIYNILEDSLNKVQLSTPEQTSLFCYYVMLKSAINDLNKMEDKNMVYAKVIYIVTKKVLNQIGKQYLSIVNTKDSEGRDFTYLVEFLDELGEKVMINKKNESNESNKEGVVHAEGEDRV